MCQCFLLAFVVNSGAVALLLTPILTPLVVPLVLLLFFSLFMQIRAFGTSNDSPYGITKMAQLGERLGYPRIASVQVAMADSLCLEVTTHNTAGANGKQHGPDTLLVSMTDASTDTIDPLPM